ncbi:iron chelate uptake ABC transporter family permease subunit [Streptococcus pluranimalium]|uniref:iron chelate uptake ABC transporter family permease subunit n=1 Tax=Streptococcus pluranimalium TaxID=82348 RepID=UPI0039ED353A
MTVISEMLSYEFMQRAVLAIVAMSLFAPLLGLFLMLRRQSLMSDTLSHVSLAGVAFGILFGVSTTWMTIVVVIFASILLEYLRLVYKHYMEISTAILMSLGLAISLLITSKSENSSGVNLEQYLFGSIITINQEQVIALFFIASLVLVLSAFFIRPMYMLTFDEDTALVDGLPVRLMSLVFNIITGVAIALMIPAAGALLVSTIMVLPASIGIRVGKSFKAVIISSIIIGFIGMLLGVILSYIWETPASATITVIFIAIFLSVSLLTALTRKIAS